MNGRTVSQKPTIVQIIAVLSASIMAIMLAFALTWCLMFKIYIEPTQLVTVSTILGGLAGSLTTILVGRTIAQLNRDDDELVPENPKEKPKK